MVFDGSTGEQLERNAVVHDETEALLILPDGKRILSAKKTGGWRLLSLPTLELLQEVTGPNRVAQQGALSPDGTDVATWQEDGTARICAVESGSVVSQFEIQLTPGKTYHWICNWHPTFNRLILVGEVFRPRNSEGPTSEPEPPEEPATPPAKLPMPKSVEPKPKTTAEEKTKVGGDELPKIEETLESPGDKSDEEPFLTKEDAEIIDLRDAGYFDASTGKRLGDSLFNKAGLMHAEFNSTGEYLLIFEVDKTVNNREEWTYRARIHGDFLSGGPLFEKNGIDHAQWIPGAASFAVTEPRGQLQVRDMAADKGASSNIFGPDWSANMSWLRDGRLLVFSVNEQAMHLLDPAGDHTRAFLRFYASEDQHDALSPNGRRWALSLSPDSFTLYSLPPSLPGREPVAGLDFTSSKSGNPTERWEASRKGFDEEAMNELYRVGGLSDWLAIVRKSSGRLNAHIPLPAGGYSLRPPVWNDQQTEVGLLPSLSTADEPPRPEELTAGAFRFIWTPPTEGNEMLQRWATALGGVRLPREGEGARLKPEMQVEEMIEPVGTEALEPIWRELLDWWREERPADRKPPLP